jgi:hypothetical protein
MKNILAENLLRFRVKNLSDDIKRKLQEQTEPVTDPNVTGGAGSKLNQTLGNVLNAKQVDLLNQGKVAVGPDVQKAIFDKYYQAQQSAVGKNLILNGVSPTSKIIGPIKAIFQGVDGAGNSRIFVWTTKIPIFNFSALQKAYIGYSGADEYKDYNRTLSQEINITYGLDAGDIILPSIINNKGLPPIADEAPGISLSYFTTKPKAYDYVIFSDKIVEGNKFAIYNNAGQQVGTIPMQIAYTSQTLDQTGIEARTNPAETKQIQALRTADPKKLTVDQKRAQERILKGMGSQR